MGRFNIHTDVTSATQISDVTRGRTSVDHDDRVIDLHRALVQGNAVTEELSTLLLERVRRVLRLRLPSVDPEMINDGAEDAILKYLSQPQRYDASRGRLETFLVTVALHRTLDLLRRQARQWRVEAEAFSRRANVAPYWMPHHQNVGEIQLSRIVKTSAERQFMLARLAGVRRTSELARALGLCHLPVIEQRRAIKRLTERLRMRIRRFRSPA